MADGVNKRRGKSSAEDLLEKYQERKERSSVELLHAQQRQAAIAEKTLDLYKRYDRSSDPEERSAYISSIMRETSAAEDYEKRVLPNIRARKETLARAGLMRDIRSLPEDVGTRVGVASRESRYVARAMEEAESFRYTPAQARLGGLQESFERRSKKIERSAIHMMEAEEGIKKYSNAPKDETTEQAIDRLTKLKEAQQKYQSSRKSMAEGSIFLEETAGQMAQIKATEREKRRRGWDPESRMLTAQGFIEREQERRGAVGLQQAVQQGQFGSFSKEQEKLGKIGEELAESFKKLIQVQKEFEEGLEGSKEKLEEASKIQDDLNESYKKQSQVVDAVRRQRDERSNVLGSALGVAGHLIDATRYATIGANLQENQARIGAMNYYNQQYSDYAGAFSSLDFSALTRANATNFGVKQGKELGNREGTLGVLGAGVLAAESVLTLGTALNPTQGLLATNQAREQLVAGTGQAMSAAKAGYGLLRGIPQLETTLASANQSRELMTTFNYIPDSIRSAVARRGLEMFDSVQGAGTASGMMSTLMSNEFIKKGSERGFDGGRIAAMMKQGVQTIGAPFEANSTKLMQRAMDLDYNRTVGAGQFLGMTGQMTQVGGSSKQVEDVIANAFARGAGNAKVFQEMVDSITQMSDRMGGNRGGNVADIVTNMMNNAMDALHKNYGSVMSEPQRQALARSEVGRWDELSKSKGMDFATAVSFAHMTEVGIHPLVGVRALEGVGIQQATKLKELALQAKTDPNKRKELQKEARVAQVESLFFNEGGELRQDVEKRAEGFYRAKEAQARIGGGGVVKEVEDAWKKGKSTPMFRDIMGTSIEARNADATQALIPNTKRSSEFKAGQDAAKMGAEFQQKQLTALGSASDTFVKSIEAMNKSLKDLDVSAIKDKAQAAGTEMKLDVAGFNKASSEFKTAVDAFVAAITNKDISPQAVLENMKKGIEGGSGKKSSMDSLGTPKGHFIPGSIF